MADTSLIVVRIENIDHDKGVGSGTRQSNKNSTRFGLFLLEFSQPPEVENFSFHSYGFQNVVDMFMYWDKVLVACFVWIFWDPLYSKTHFNVVVKTYVALFWGLSHSHFFVVFYFIDYAGITFFHCFVCFPHRFVDLLFH